jgi:hypothetical protein
VRPQTVRGEGSVFKDILIFSRFLGAFQAGNCISSNRFVSKSNRFSPKELRFTPKQCRFVIHLGRRRQDTAFSTTNPCPSFAKLTLPGNKK